MDVVSRILDAGAALAAIVALILSWWAIHEMRMQRRDAAATRVVVTYVDAVANNTMELQPRNIGNSPAFDLRISTTHREFGFSATSAHVPMLEVNRDTKVILSVTNRDESLRRYATVIDIPWPAAVTRSTVGYADLYQRLWMTDVSLRTSWRVIAGFDAYLPKSLGIPVPPEEWVPDVLELTAPHIRLQPQRLLPWASDQRGM